MCGGGQQTPTKVQPTYDVPAKKSRKRKMAGTIDHVPPWVEETISKGVKRKLTDQQTDTPAIHPKNGPHMLINQKETLRDLSN